MQKHSAVEIELAPPAKLLKAPVTECRLPVSPSRNLPVLAFLSSLLIVIAVSGTPQSLFSDPSWQLKGLQQHLAGESPTFNTLVQADPHDISQDARQWISWWPIGTNVLVYPMLRLGLSMGTAIRVLTSLSFILGSIGFGYWLQVFRLPRWLSLTLAITIPWIHYANLSLFQYAAEGLVFGVCPWLLVGAIRIRSQWMNRQNVGLGFLAGFGLLLGFAYWMKYSAIFISAGILMHLAITARRQGRSTLRDLALMSTAFALVVGFLNGLNHWMGAAMNAVTEHVSFALDWHLPVNFVGLMGMAMADADGLARYILFHPGRKLLEFNYVTLCYVGLPGGILLFWLLLRRHCNPALLLSRDVLVTLSALFLAVMTVFSARAMEARYIAAIGIALIPAAVECVIELRPPRILRGILLSAAICYVAVPIAYGGFSVVGKIARTPTAYRSGPSGLYNPLFASMDAKSPIAQLTADFAASSDVWYLTEAYTAMDLPGRVILRDADFLSMDRLKESYRTSKPIRVHLLLPPWFEQNGKGSIIRADFSGAGNWVPRTIPGMNYIEWTATLSRN